VNPAIPADAEALVLKELSKDPERRSQSAAEMLEAFRGLAAYTERQRGMSVLGTQLRAGVASGDLGASTDRGSSSASRVLSQMAKATPGVWSGTAARKGPRPAVVGALVAGALIAVAAIAFVLLQGRQPPAAVVAPIAPPAAAPAPTAPVAPAPTAAPAAAARVVSIHVVGAPAGAEILWDGAAVPMNPFSVEPSAGLVKLEVRADGFEPYATMVAPSEDRELAVSLDKAAKGGHGKKAAPPAEAKAAPAPEAKAEPKPEAKPEPKPEAGSKLKEGKRGTKFGDSFE
jgi:hypothetical protein